MSEPTIPAPWLPSGMKSCPTWRTSEEHNSSLPVTSASCRSFTHLVTAERWRRTTTMRRRLEGLPIKCRTVGWGRDCTSPASPPELPFPQPGWTSDTVGEGGQWPPPCPSLGEARHRLSMPMHEASLVGMGIYSYRIRTQSSCKIGAKQLDFGRISPCLWVYTAAEPTGQRSGRAHQSRWHFVNVSWHHLSTPIAQGN